MKQRKRILYLGLIFWNVLFLCGCQKEAPVLVNTSHTETSQEEAEEETDARQGEELQSQTEHVLCVYVCGAVHSSGVYTLAEGSRVYEAIAAAGGLTEEADEYYVNQAQLLTDGMQITVPAKGETAGNGQNFSAVTAEPGKINLNRASLQELQTLTGIGQVKAAAIVAYREEHGQFASIEEIQQVDGISEKIYEKIKEQIMV
ncbi:MAG: helix-hairpin-helix domain-containing protein [Lachnospiraceae bacterium]|jgi:competence protein ComEA